MPSDALFLPSANWYCSQLGAWGQPRDGSSTYYFAFGCKSRVAMYQVELSSEGTFSQPRFVADLGRGKHDKKVTSVTFIHGAYHELLLVCAGEEGSIQIWNASTLELVDHHKKHKSTEVMAISSKDDNVIVGGDRNGVLSVWTRSTGHIGLHVPIPGDCIYSIDVCPQRKHHVAIGYRSGKLVVVDITDGSIVTRFKGHDEEIHAVTWRPNNATADAKPVLASSSRDKRIRLWEGATALNDQGGNASMLHEWTLPRPKKAVSSHQMGRLWLTCCWVPSSNFSVVCSSITGDLFRLEWTPKQKKVTAPTTFKHNHTRLVFNIAPLVVAYNKVLLLSISMDRDVRLTDAMSMECHAKLTGLGGHVYALSYNAKKALVAGGVGDNTIRLVDLAKSTTELLWKGLQSKVTAVAWNPLGSSMLAYATEEGHIGLYNGQDHTRFKTYHGGGLVRQVLWVVHSFPSENTTADDWIQSLESMQVGGDVSLEELKAPADSAPSTTSCVLWSCAVDGVVYASNPDAPDANSIAMNKRWGVPQVTCMAWLGGMVALGTPEGAVVVVKRQGLTAWTRVHTFYDHTKAVTAVAWCATSSQLATASNDATICVYALDGGVLSPLKHCLTGHGGGITCLDWSPSGVYLASASVDSTVQVWKVGRSEGYNFREHSGRVLAVTWVDDATLASGGDDQSIRKWTFADLPHTMPPKPKHIAEGAVMTAGPKRSVACTSTKKNKAAGLASIAPTSSTTMFHTSSPSNKLAIEIIPTSGHALTDFLRSERAQFEAEGDVEAAGRLLLLQGRIGEALRLVSRHEKLSPVWLAHAPMAGLDVWREYTRLYADRCRDKRNFGDAVEAFLSIGEVYAAIECLVKGSMWKEALTLIHLRCAPSDPILQETTLLYIAHLKAQEMWRDAGTLLQSLSMTDQAISCFLKQHDTLGVALELMDPTCTSVLTLVDIGTRGVLNRQFEVVERVVHLLSAATHKAQAFLLQVFVFYTQDQLSDTPPTGWMLDDTSTLWSHLHDKANVDTLPLCLQTMLDQVAPKSDKVWARLIPYVQSLVGDVDDIEDAFAGGVIDTAFVKLMEANAVGYMVVKCLCQMSLDLVQGNFLAAFEAWSACLAQVAPLTSSNKGDLLEVCALVFPTGVNSTPPPVGELVTDSACSRELWATFFLYQSVAFSRSLRAAADADDDNDHRRQEVQGALLFVIQWINQLLPATVLQDMDESVVRVAQTALNDLSLLYHQLLDDNRPPLAEISAPST